MITLIYIYSANIHYLQSIYDNFFKDIPTNIHTPTNDTKLDPLILEPLPLQSHYLFRRFVILFLHFLFLVLHYNLNNIYMAVLFRVSSNTYLISKLILVPSFSSFSIWQELFSFNTITFCPLVSI